MNTESANNLLRITTAGSVDDGKSTLIGRLILESGSVYEDQLEAVKRASLKRGLDFVDLSLLTDGLAAEREQSITIDVAYRYMALGGKKIVIADVPGHEQYTRNMVTGASGADLAIILVDGRKGLLPQTKRHLFIASLLGIPDIMLAINKMDEVGYSQAAYQKIVDDCQNFAKQLPGKKLQFMPVSALKGDMVVSRGKKLGWYAGPTLIEYLKNAEPATPALTAVRLPIQLVIRPNMDFRGYAGQLVSGRLRAGDEVIALPGKRPAKIRSIFSAGKEVAEADVGQAVTVTLDRELDVSRGDLISDPANLPHLGDKFRATLCWLDNQAAEPGKSYLLKQTTKITRATIDTLEAVYDIENLKTRAAERLSTNDIGIAKLTAHAPLSFDAYKDNRFTGSFILIDELTKNTAAAGLIESPLV